MACCNVLMQDLLDFVKGVLAMPDVLKSLVSRTS